MARRTQRGVIDKTEVLAKLQEGRRGLLMVCTKARIGSEEYQSAERALEAVDDLADRLTGNPRSLHAPPHRSG